MKIPDLLEFIGVTSSNSNEVGDSSTKANETTPEHSFQPSVAEETLFVWEASNRTPRNINSKLLRNLIIVTVVVILLFALMGEYLFIVAIASIVFLAYILSATPVQTVRHKITNKGIFFSGVFYDWALLRRFFFTEKSGALVLNIDTKSELPGRLYFVIKPENKEKIKEIISRYIMFLEEPPKDFLDKTYESIVGKFTFSR